MPRALYCSYAMEDVRGELLKYINQNQKQRHHRKQTCIKLRNREMENGETKTVPKSWAMVGGDGPRSYAQNSSYQVYILSLNIFYRLT